MATSPARRSLVLATLVWGAAFASSPARAEDVPVVLLLDRNAIAAADDGSSVPGGPSGNVQGPARFAAGDLNAAIAAVGMRDPLPFFARHVGHDIVLPVGPAGHEGWFAPASMPAAWMSAPGLDDAPQNFWLAGPGLGSPDEEGNRASLLDSVQALAPLTAAQLQALAGRPICALVYAGEIPWSDGGTSLGGSTLGTIAFWVVGVAGADAASVGVRILEAGPACGAALSLASF